MYFYFKKRKFPDSRMKEGVQSPMKKKRRLSECPWVSDTDTCPGTQDVWLQPTGDKELGLTPLLKPQSIKDLPCPWKED